MKIKFSEIIDKVFINVLLVLILFLWFRFFCKNTTLALFLSFLTTLIINIILQFFNRNKKYKYEINKNLNQDIELYMMSLISNSQKENVAFFEKIIKQKHPTKTKNGFIIFKQNNKDCAIFPFFEKRDLSLEYVLKILNIAKKNLIKKIYICCYECQNKIRLEIEKINADIKILQKKQLYFELFRTSNIYPKINLELKQGKKMRFRELFEISFAKNKTKAYFFSGLLIFFCSFIMRYNIYYVFMSSILFLFAILSFKNKEEKFEKEIF